MFPRSPLGSVVKTGEKEIRYKILWPLQFILEGIIFNVRYLINFKIKRKFNLAICFDPLSFIHTYLSKKILQIDLIIYFNVDFSTKRYGNNIANFIYLLLNRFAFRKCDTFFSITRDFLEKIDPAGDYAHKTFLLKHTVNIVHPVSVSRIPNSIVFVGSLSHTVDFKNLLKALEMLKNDSIDFVFDIYGTGHQKEELENLIHDSPIGPAVHFQGVVNNEVLLQQVLPKYMIGVCPYITREHHYETDHMFNGTDLTTKIVEYIGSGLPVITTRLYDAFDVIEKKRFGFIVQSPDEWYTALKKLLVDGKLYEEYRSDALNFAQNYDEEAVYTPIFTKILGKRIRK